MKKSLLPLLLGGLGIGTTEFVMMGLLQDIASDLHITIPEAGHLISAYALGVVVGAPLLVMLSVKHPPKKILLTLMLIFTVFNALSAFSPSPVTLLMARFFAGLPHGAFFGVGSVVASRLADKGKQAQAIAVMFSGLTIANLVMVPIGTWIGHHLLWRYTFGLVAVIGLITLVAIKLWLPALPANENADPKKEMEIVKNPQAWLVIAITAVGTGGMFAWISYISPLMTEVSRFSPDSVSWIMVLAGFGMIVGNLIGGKLADRFQPVYTCAGLLLCMAVNLLAIHYFSGYQFISLFLTFMTGALSMMIAAPIQILMINTSGDSEMLGAALIQAAFNIGNSLGAFLGGLPIVMGYGFTYPVVVGDCMAVIGVGFAIRLIKMQNPPVRMDASGTTGMAV